MSPRSLFIVAGFLGGSPLPMPILRGGNPVSTFLIGGFFMTSDASYSLLSDRSLLSLSLLGELDKSFYGFCMDTLF
jgi:hypothetical protein